MYVFFLEIAMKYTLSYLSPQTILCLSCVFFLEATHYDYISSFIA